MENVVHPVHGILDTLEVAHITDVELDLVGRFRHLGLEFVAHVVLLFLVAAENADFANIGLEEAVEHSITKATRTTGNQESLITENGA